MLKCVCVCVCVCTRACFKLCPQILGSCDSYIGSKTTGQDRSACVCACMCVCVCMCVCAYTCAHILCVHTHFVLCGTSLITRSNLIHPQVYISQFSSVHSRITIHHSIITVCRSCICIHMRTHTIPCNPTHTAQTQSPKQCPIDRSRAGLTVHML